MYEVRSKPLNQIGLCGINRADNQTINLINSSSQFIFRQITFYMFYISNMQSHVLKQFIQVYRNFVIPI